MKNDAEVRDVVFGTISTLGRPIQVVFKNHRCLDCGETGDSRLMPMYCHMEPVFVHPGNIVQYHPGKIERHHDSSTLVREHSGTKKRVTGQSYDHLTKLNLDVGGLYRPWYSCNFIFCNMGGERYTCCGALNGQPGCIVIRNSCQTIDVLTFYCEGIMVYVTVVDYSDFHLATCPTLGHVAKNLTWRETTRSAVVRSDILAARLGLN